MKKEQLWEKYCERNPSFKGKGMVAMSAAGLKKFFDQAYDKGHEEGIANGRAMEAMAKSKPSNQGKDPMDIFGDIFRK